MKRYIFLLAGLLYGSISLSQQLTNKGREFWLAHSYFKNITRPAMTLSVTADVAATYTVEIYGVAVIATGTVAAGQVKNIVVPLAYFIDGDGLFVNKAIHVTSDKPVTLYSFITGQNSCGATLCLPYNVLGEKYIAMGLQQYSTLQNSNSFITIVATDDSTNVEITPAATTVAGWLPKSVHVIALKKGEVYQVLGKEEPRDISGVYNGADLSGTSIRSIGTGTGSCKKIAVFSGSGKTKVIAYSNSPNDNSLHQAENLYQQLYPTVNWGTKFFTVPSYQDSVNNYRIYKLDTSRSNTQVKLNHKLIYDSLFVNGFYEFVSQQPNVIESNKAICVAQYFASSGYYTIPCPGPEMIILNPVEQRISKVTTVNSDLVAPATHYIDVTMSNGGTGTASFRLDGATIPPGSWVVHPQDPATSYLSLHNLPAGSHTLSADSGFNAVTYGYGTASYGYSAGFATNNPLQYLGVTTQYGLTDAPSVCTGSPFRFKLKIPYYARALTWDFSQLPGGIANVVQTAPVIDSTTYEAYTEYWYSVPNFYTLNTAGTFPVTVTVTTLGSPYCGDKETIDFQLEVTAPQIADFKWTPFCAGDANVQFTDNTISEKPTYKWTWDFGDIPSGGNNTSAVKNPVHTFSGAGPFTVKYSNITTAGCVSSIVSHQVVENPVPVAAFTFTPPFCETKLITFNSSTSTVTAGNITGWHWDFGDAANASPANPDTSILQNPTHRYPKAGIYTVTLKVISDKGCTSIAKTQTVTISESPRAGFIDPVVCLKDPFAQFTDSSKIGGTASITNWQWDFGDAANATPANPNTSTATNPKHIYIQAGTYPVQLIVTGSTGCMDTVTHSIFVNDADPVADFAPASATANCANDSVAIINRSVIASGKITKLEIYWDVTGAPAVAETDYNPVNGKLYRHKYPDFQTPAFKTFTITIKAYSGGSCFSDKTGTITVNASPKLQFGALPGACIDVPAFKITGAKEIGGVAGSGMYSGTGVTMVSPGEYTFNPATAGVGKHTITYTFISAAAGCTAVDSAAIMVYPKPAVNTGPDLVVLFGKSIVLQPQVAGTDLQYLWSWSTGGSGYLDDAKIKSPVARPVNDITYQLTVTATGGCTASDAVSVKVITGFKVANTFSPNGDGINETWDIKYLNGYPGCRVQVFTRSGQKVFESKGYKTPWNGKFNGKPLPMDTYYYIIEIADDVTPLTGYITIIK